MADPSADPPTGRSMSRRGSSSGLLGLGVVVAAVVLWWLASGNGPSPSGIDVQLAVPDRDATAGAAPTPRPEPPVRIVAYRLLDPTHLELEYTVTCEGEVESPLLLETDAAVSVTLRMSAAGSPCRPVSRPGSVRVLLDSPLNGRSVLDASRSPQVRVEPVER